MDCSLDATYADMEKRGICVVHCKMQSFSCLSLQNGRIVGVDTDKFKTQAEERTAIIHEDGHFESGAFYLPFSPFQIKEQAEFRAEKAAILKHVPYEFLCEEMAAGFQLFEIAEHLNLTERCILNAYLLYKDMGYSFAPM